MTEIGTLAPTVVVYKIAPELHLLILWTRVKFLKMRTENVSGAHFIYCQCGCSQLMLQNRVT